MTELMKRLALCLALLAALTLAMVLCGTALAAERGDGKGTARDTDSEAVSNESAVLKAADGTVFSVDGKTLALEQGEKAWGP